MTTKEEYLKRYLSKTDTVNPTQDTNLRNKKKKIRRTDKPFSDSRMKIVDDDIDLKSLDNRHSRGEDPEAAADDAPTVAQFIDERPDRVKQLEAFRQNKSWKVLGSNDRHEQDSHPSSSRPAPRTARHDSDSDPSPPRRQRAPGAHGCDVSSPRRPRADSDQSPPRKRGLHADSDQSPPRNSRQTIRHDSDADMSPPRQPQTGRGRTPDVSPPRRLDSRRNDDSDLSPVRQRGKASQQDSGENSLSKRKKMDDDLYPPRPKKEEGVLAMKTMSGTSAGLQSRQDMVQEARKLKHKQDLAFKHTNDDVSGRYASVIHRDKKSGKQRDMVEEKAIQDVEDKKKEEDLAKYKEWNKGLKQKELQAERLADALHEADKPLARYKDDSDLDDLLRDRVRVGEVDPMLAFIKKNAAKNKTGPVKPRYSGREPMPNRFNIWPGYRWDGVDRSNGFEKQLFSTTAERNVMKDIASKWSVEDM